MPNPTLARVHVDELAQFREIQQLAYACVEAVSGMLRPGMTKKDAAKLLTEWLG
ncbi:MAG: Xaa-Pro aminopeptidase, partial [Ralstonia sp.]|nr:Xaa-Pro aminopeptidase [Ralstonia sp.]